MTHVRFHNRPSLNQVIDSLFQEWPGLFPEHNHRHSVPVNIREIDNAYLLEVIAPGFEKSDFKVNLEGDLLTISVERTASSPENKDKWVRREYGYRNFKRSFTIDEKIDATQIQASYVNGVLTLNLPKKTEVKETSKAIVIN